MENNQKNYFKENKEKIREQQTEYYKENREKIREQQKIYYANIKKFAKIKIIGEFIRLFL